MPRFMRKERRKDRRRPVLIPALLNDRRVNLVNLSLGGVGVEIPSSGLSLSQDRIASLHLGGNGASLHLGGNRAFLHLGGNDEPVAVMMIHGRTSSHSYRAGAMFLKLTGEQFNYVQSLLLCPHRH